jgi:hypothetical protein
LVVVAKGNIFFCPEWIRGRSDRTQPVLAFDLGDDICSSAATSFKILRTKISNIRVHVVGSLDSLRL